VLKLNPEISEEVSASTLCDMEENKCNVSVWQLDHITQISPLTHSILYLGSKETEV